MERETVTALNPGDDSKAAPAALALPVPANLIDFVAIYGDEVACLEALIAARWPDGFACPRCGHGNRRLIECSTCWWLTRTAPTPCSSSARWA